MRPMTMVGARAIMDHSFTPQKKLNWRKPGRWQIGSIDRLIQTARGCRLTITAVQGTRGRRPAKRWKNMAVVANRGALYWTALRFRLAVDVLPGS